MPEPERKPNIPAALGTAAVCLAFVVFVLVYDDLRYLRFAQVMSSAVMTLALAVILFSIVPASAPVAAAVGLGGAALFYWKVLPVIMMAAFPQPATQAIHGGIYYLGDSDLVLRPVSGVIVKVPGSSLQSSPTNESGEFLIENVPDGVHDLEAEFKSAVYPLDLRKATKVGNKYRFKAIPADAARSEAQPSLKLPNSLLVDATLSVTGQSYDRKVAPARPPDYYIGTSRDETQHARICAQPQDDFIVDKTRAGFTGGLQITSTGGDNYHSELWDGDCFALYAAWNNGRGSNSWARGVNVALKRLRPEGACGEPQEKKGAALTYTGANQLQFDSAKALGGCGDPDVPSPPKWLTTAIFHDATGNNLETVSLSGFEQKKALSGKADIWLSSTGALNILLHQ